MNSHTPFRSSHATLDSGNSLFQQTLALTAATQTKRGDFLALQVLALTVKVEFGPSRSHKNLKYLVHCIHLRPLGSCSVLNQHHSAGQQRSKQQHLKKQQHSKRLSLSSAALASLASRPSASSVSKGSSPSQQRQKASQASSARHTTPAQRCSCPQTTTWLPARTPHTHKRLRKSSAKKSSPKGKKK